MWAWDKSKAVVRHSVLQADSTYVLLTHGEAHADVQVWTPQAATVLTESSPHMQ